MTALKRIYEAPAGMRIPVIDIGPYLAGEPGALAATAQALGEASEGLGFYFIGNHRVPQSLIDRVFVEAERFHSLPIERKLAVRCLDRVVGYLPLSHQTQYNTNFAKSRHPDRSASYYIRNEYPADHPYRAAGHGWVFDNRWPEDLPGFRDATLEYFTAMSELAQKFLTLQSVALGLPADYLGGHAAFRPFGNTLRLLCYPPRDPALDGQFGIGPHTDYGYMTFLAQEKRPGLEILSPTGDWIKAPALDGHFLVNHADMCRRWTNDRFRSAPHRVINPGTETRYSIPFFVGPRPDVRLECLPTRESLENPRRYGPISFAEYMAEIGPKNYHLDKQEV